MLNVKKLLTKVLEDIPPLKYSSPSTGWEQILWGNYVNVTGMIQVLTNGDVKIYASSAQSDVQAWVSFTYCVA